jgi:hypothetical protein
MQEMCFYTEQAETFPYIHLLSVPLCVVVRTSDDGIWRIDRVYYGIPVVKTFVY